MALKAETYAFFNALNKNNNRDWFNKNKARYQAAHDDVAGLAAELIENWSKIEETPIQDPRKSLFRIYRDVRFSKDKSPYKSWLAFQIKRAGEGSLGLYVHLAPGDTIAATGVYQPDAKTLKAIRQEIDYNAKALRKILAAKGFRDTFGEMRGEALKTAPKGYDKEHPDIDLLRMKQFLAYRSFTDKEALSPGFGAVLLDTFKKARPFMEYFDTVIKEVGGKAD